MTETSDKSSSSAAQRRARDCLGFRRRPVNDNLRHSEGDLSIGQPSPTSEGDLSLTTFANFAILSPNPFFSSQASPQQFRISPADQSPQNPLEDTSSTLSTCYGTVILSSHKRVSPILMTAASLHWSSPAYSFLTS